MKITDFNINMASSSEKTEIYTKQERLSVSMGMQAPRASDLKESINDFIEDQFTLSKQAEEYLANFSSASSVDTINDLQELGFSEHECSQIMVLKAIIEKLTGKKIEFYLPSKNKGSSEDINLNPFKNMANSPLQASRGMTLKYESREAFYHKETMSFRSEGVVKTADGRVIDFEVDLNLSREFAMVNEIEFVAGETQLVDPLVIHFDGVPPSMTEAKYQFDLDVDGTLDSMSFVGPGSGFLALDKNKDGIINDGSELFGPQSGDGFAELAKYDEDGNGWIDENDSIYHELVIWTKDEYGNDKLFALGDKNIGAIYLGNVSSGYGLRDKDFNSQAQIAKTGIFLKESGQAGLIQHIDIAI